MSACIRDVAVYMLDINSPARRPPCAPMDRVLSLRRITLTAKAEENPLNLFMGSRQESEDTRRRRMLARGDSPDAVERRIEHDRKAFCAYRNTLPDYYIGQFAAENPVKRMVGIIAENWPEEEA